VPIATKPAPRRPGRPTKLTDDVAWRLIGLIASGVPITHAAAEVGVDRRSVERWRARAYSTRAEDRACVEFEQALTRALLAATEGGRPSARVIAGSSSLLSLDELLAEFDGDVGL
jgi:hypothetical protein